MSFSLTNKFWGTARGITFKDGGGLTWSLNPNTNEVTLAGAGGGGVALSSVGVDDQSTTPIYSITNSPLIANGTIHFILQTQVANAGFFGPTSGGAAQPTFRAMVLADLPAGIVGLADGSGTAIMNISGSPANAGGTLTFALKTQTANLVLAGPTSGTAQPTFRLLVAGDIPALAYVTSVALSDGSTSPLYAITGSPVTSSGTLTFTLKTQLANVGLFGPTTGAAAQPTFRAMVVADLPTGIPNANLANSSLTVTAGTGLSGGGAVSLGGSVTLSLTNPVAVTLGGTGLASYTIGDMLYADTTTTLAKLADVAAGSYLRSGGAATAPVWSTLTLPNAATQGDLLIATGANAIGRLADVASGSYLRSGGASANPLWSTLVLPNAATQGDILIATAANTVGSLADVAAGSYLRSGGASTAPVWSTITIPNAATLGDIWYSDVANDIAALAGNTTSTRKFLRQTGTGTVSAAPAWDTLVAGDIPALGGNPSVKVTLSAQNGSATTYLRSDGAPALDQSISPTWTGNHIFSPASGDTKATAGNLLWIATAVGASTAGRTYLSMKGSTLGAFVEIQTAQADADGNVMGGLQWADINNGTARPGVIRCQLSGATANNRGGAIIFTTKQNGASTTQDCLVMTNVGMLQSTTTKPNGSNTSLYAGTVGLRTANSTLTSVTALAADTSLQINVPETGVYQVEAEVFFFEDTSSAGGFQMDFGTSGATVGNLNLGVSGQVNGAFTNVGITSQTTALSFATISTSASAPSWLSIEGLVNITATGNFGIRTAQVSSSANSTHVLAYSILKLTKVG